MPPLTSAPEGATSHGSRPAPGSLGAVGRGWLVAIFLACAGYAAAVALLASSGVQHSWAVVAAPCYAAAAVAAAWPRRGRDLALLLSLGGGLAAPLGWLVAENRSLQEVRVISHGAWLLIQHGTPYLSVATLAGAQNPEAYNPYLPAMTLFGLGRAAGRGPLADPRILVHRRVRRRLLAGPSGRRRSGQRPLDRAGDRDAGDRLPARRRRR